MRFINSFVTYYLHYRAYQTNRSGSRGISLASISSDDINSSRLTQIYPLRIDIDLEICSRVFLAGLFFFQAEDGIRDVERSRGLGDVYKRQLITYITALTKPIVLALAVFPWQVSHHMTLITRDAKLILISRFVHVCREFFWPIENFFHQWRIYLLVENLLAGREFLAARECFFLFRDNLIGECRG